MKGIILYFNELRNFVYTIALRKINDFDFNFAQICKFWSFIIFALMSLKCVKLVCEILRTCR